MSTLHNRNDLFFILEVTVSAAAQNMMQSWWIDVQSSSLRCGTMIINFWAIQKLFKCWKLLHVQVCPHISKNSTCSQSRWLQVNTDGGRNTPKTSKCHVSSKMCSLLKGIHSSREFTKKPPPKHHPPFSSSRFHCNIIIVFSQSFCGTHPESFSHNARLGLISSQRVNFVATLWKSQQDRHF